jgi:CheY-like chemotaxis protein
MTIPENTHEWNVLVVDDHSDFARQIQAILEHHGATVHTASEGAHCLEMARSLKPTMIITDLAMPVIDGWRLLEELRENPATANIPVIAITAYHSSDVEASAFRVGFDAYFPKPVEAGSFVAKLGQMLRPA